jgi:hypothetical protein
MQIAITIPDEVAAQAHKLGIPVKVYVQNLIEQVRPKSPEPQVRSAQQIEDFLAAMAEGSEKLPLLPTGSFGRETFYEDPR